MRVVLAMRVRLPNSCCSLSRSGQLDLDGLQSFALHVNMVKEHEDCANERGNCKKGEELAEGEAGRLEKTAEQGSAYRTEPPHGKGPSDAGRTDEGGVDLPRNRVLA